MPKYIVLSKFRFLQSFLKASPKNMSRSFTRDRPHVSPHLPRASLHMRRIFNSRCVLSALLYVVWGGTSMSFPTLTTAGTANRTKTLALSVVSVAVLAAAGYGLWAWTTQQTTVADKDASEAAAQLNAGGVHLNAAQLRAQDVETALVKDAAVIPLDGLPAQTVAPLSASAQVVAPYGGVVTRVLVDEGAAVRQDKLWHASRARTFWQHKPIWRVPAPKRRWLRRRPGAMPRSWPRALSQPRATSKPSARGGCAKYVARGQWRPRTASTR